MDLTQRRESARELLEAEAHVHNHMVQIASSMSLRCAVELGIPDVIHNHGRPMTLFELVDALPVALGRTGHANRLMRLLVHSGFFALEKNSDGEEGYVLTPSSRLLLKDSNPSLSSFLLWMTDQLFMTPLYFLAKWFQGSEETAMETALGMSFWKCMAQNPEAGKMYNEAMVSVSRVSTKVLVEEFGEVFKGMRSIVDVGGGYGACTMTIAKAFPHIKCTVLDLPHVVGAVTQKVRDLDFVGGDMFESIPKADAIFLQSVLHDWGDDECVKILKRCKEAIPSKEKGGKVIVVDVVVDPEHGEPKSEETKIYLDLLIMSVGGKERDEFEWRKIFTDAGLTVYKISPVLGWRSVIELYPG